MFHLLALGALLPRSVALSVSARSPRDVGTRTVGVDFGLRRVGLAISSGFAPMPHSVLPCPGDAEDDFARVARAIATVAAGEGAGQLVLGLPYNSTGGEGEQAAVTRTFATILANAVCPKPLYLWDERFSSAEAAQRMHGGRGAARGELLDAVAAAVILEDFFADDEPSVPHRVPERVEPTVTAAPRPQRPPSPPPLSQAEVKAAMRARIAQQQAALDASKGARGKKKRRK
jgi:putative Holliday junction resolvase